MSLKKRQGYLAIVKLNGEIRIGVCHHDSHYGLIQFILRDVKYLHDISSIFDNVKLINEHCDIIKYLWLMKSKVCALKGYFVNELMNKFISMNSYNDDRTLTISSRSPDIVAIPEKNVLLHECIINCNKYTVIYIPHDKLSHCKMKNNKNMFCIPFKLEILNNKW